MTPSIKTIPVNNDSVICSLQIQDGTGKPVNPFKVEKVVWTVTPDSMFQAPATPGLIDIERKLICPAHTEPVTAIVTIEAEIDLLDGKGLRLYWARTIIQFGLISPASMVINVTEA